MGITYDRLLNWTASSMTVSNMNVNRDHRYDAEFDLSYEEKLSLINDKSEDKVSKAMDLVEKFFGDYSEFPCTQYGTARRDAIKKWLKANDTEGLFKKNSFSPEYEIWLFGQRHNLCGRFFTSSQAFKVDRKAFVNEVFRDWLNELKRMEQYHYLDHDDMTPKAEAFDYDTWNNSILSHLLYEAGIKSFVKTNEFGGKRIVMFNRENYHASKEGYELTEADMDMFYRKRDEIEAFIKKVAASSEITKIVDCIENIANSSEEEE